MAYGHDGKVQLDRTLCKCHGKGSFTNVTVFPANIAFTVEKARIELYPTGTYYEPNHVISMRLLLRYVLMCTL